MKIILVLKDGSNIRQRAVFVEVETFDGCLLSLPLRGSGILSLFEGGCERGGREGRRPGIAPWQRHSLGREKLHDSRWRCAVCKAPLCLSQRCRAIVTGTAKRKGKRRETYRGNDVVLGPSQGRVGMTCTQRRGPQANPVFPSFAKPRWRLHHQLTSAGQATPCCAVSNRAVQCSAVQCRPMAGNLPIDS